MRSEETRRAFTFAVAVLGCLSFLVAAVKIQARTIKTIEFSPLNVMARILNDPTKATASFSSIAETVKGITRADQTEVVSADNKEDADRVSLGLDASLVIPLVVVVAYLSLILTVVQ